MRSESVSDDVLARLSSRVADTMGLYFPRERWDDLRRGLTGAAPQLGFSEVAKCGEWLCTAALSKVQMQVLADHLTIGETYFFREPRAFEALTHGVLPELIRSRQMHDRRLRVWSAACCTGEEPYSLAIHLSQVMPDFKDWQVTILATDINTRFLQKAAAGVYGEWSFRDTPPGFKETYFRRTPEGRYAILPSIKQRVTFRQLNLVEDSFPSLATDTNAMDLIFCRNVLMYFSPAQLSKAVENLRHSLVDGGWFVVSPSEVSQSLYPGFKTVNFPGAVWYRKGEGHAAAASAGATAKDGSREILAAPSMGPVEVEMPTVAREEDTIPSQRSQTIERAQRFFAEGRYAEASELLLCASPGPSGAPEISLLARSLANQAELRAALVWCDRWLVEDKLDASGHYLRAVILQELGENDAARQGLQRAIYLRPDFVLAHFALGNLARAHGSAADAQRHLGNALHLARQAPAEEILPEADGLTAGRLSEIIHSLLNLETAAS